MTPAERAIDKYLGDGERGTLGGQPVPQLYPAAGTPVGGPASTCLSIDAGSLPSADSKTLRLAAYPGKSNSVEFGRMITL